MFGAGIFMTNIYNSVVDAKSWGADIPDSILTARNYYKDVTPADFFRTFSPINQVLSLFSLILFWKTSKKVRVYLALAFIFYLLGDLFTFSYFYPRNDIIFIDPISDVARIKEAWEGWSTMNWVRSLIVLTGVSFSFGGLNEYYKTIISK